MTETPRCLHVPYVTIGPDPTKVITRTPLDVDTFYETVLTPDEAECLGLYLMLDAKRAKAALRSQIVTATPPSNTPPR
jgi:hypothetical protein